MIFFFKEVNTKFENHFLNETNQKTLQIDVIPQTSSCNFLRQLKQNLIDLSHK